MNPSLSTIFSSVYFMCRLNDGLLVASYRSELRDGSALWLLPNWENRYHPPLFDSQNLYWLWSFRRRLLVVNWTINARKLEIREGPANWNRYRSHVYNFLLFRCSFPWWMHGVSVCVILWKLMLQAETFRYPIYNFKLYSSLRGTKWPCRTTVY